jgi:6-phosphofructokinase 2
MAKSMAGMQVFIDTSGPALNNAVENPTPGLALLRMNSSEAEEIAGHALPERIHTADFASELVARGVARRVIIARGADGSVMAEAGRRLWCCPTPHEVVSRVGAGDSSVAGWTLGMARDLPAELALRMAVAAASSAVAAPGTELCNLPEVEALMPLCSEGTL